MLNFLVGPLEVSKFLAFSEKVLSTGSLSLKIRRPICTMDLMTRYASAFQILSLPLLMRIRLSLIRREVVNGIAFVCWTDLAKQQISDLSTGHFLHLPTGTAYNGAKPIAEDMQNPSRSRQKLPTLNRESYLL